MEDNNQLLAEANELLRHYDERVIREREKFIREIEKKNKGINRTTKPTAHSSFQKDIRNHEKSEKENIEKRNEILNKQQINFKNRRISVHQNSDTDDSEQLEFGGNVNQDRTRRATIRNRPTRRSRVDRDDRETEDDSELNENIDNHPRTTTHFPFGMTQTPFQVMSNWPLKFRNNKEDSPAHFLDDLKRFKRGYQISGSDILENLDALLTEDAKDWCLINKNSWRTLQIFSENLREDTWTKNFRKR